MDVEHAHDSWTCRRNFDGVLVQTNFIVTDLTTNVEIVWHDCAVGVHCVLRCFVRSKTPKHVHLSMTGWRPHLDENQPRAQILPAIRGCRRDHNSISLANVENTLLNAARWGRFVSMTHTKFQQSTFLSPLRMARNIAADDDKRKRLNFHIWKLHKHEVKLWQTSQVQNKFGSLSCWKYLWILDFPIYGRFIVKQPSPDDLDNMLAQMFFRDFRAARKVWSFEGPPWFFYELKHAIHHLKSNKSGDDIGLVTKMLRHVLRIFTTLFTLYNDVFGKGVYRKLGIPLGFSCWQNHRGRKNQVISDQLPAFVCCICF